MEKLFVSDLLSLEDYARARGAMRAEVMAHKKNRRVQLGAHMTLLFEDRLTMRYQVQEMLRAERIFEPEGVREELDAYNPLIPDGRNWKATLMIEYPDPAERARRLAELRGVERQLWARVGDGARLAAVADEDLERENDEKTSAVHFMRFELDDAALVAARAGAPLEFGCDHDLYREAIVVPEKTRASLAADLDG